MPYTHRNAVIGTLAVDGRAATFGTATKGLGGAAVIKVSRKSHKS